MKQQLLEDPYNSINGYFEGILPKTGGKISRYASLLPPSVMIPRFSMGDKKIRSSISILLLMPSSGGKTSFLEQFRKIAPSPLEFEYITQPKIAKELDESREVTIIINDMSRVMKDQKVMKHIENVTEEGVFRYLTDRGERTAGIDKPIRASLFGVGVPHEITAHISGGFIFRVVPIVISHDMEEQKKIGRHISDKVNVGNEGDITIDDISDFVKLLKKIQRGKDKDNPRVTGFKLTDPQRDKIFENWSKALEKLEIDETSLWFRELLDGFRFTHALTMLNYFNREKVDYGDSVGLVPEREDIETAAKLMRYEIYQKNAIIRLKEIGDKIKKIKKINL